MAVRPAGPWERNGGLNAQTQASTNDLGALGEDAHPNAAMIKLRNPNYLEIQPVCVTRSCGPPFA